MFKQLRKLVAEPQPNMKFGFTLAEVLITLGIIGIVAAMTIPTLIQNQQKRKMEAVLKEDYSIIQQVMKFTEYDDVSLDLNVPDNLDGAKNWFNTFMQPHLKYASVCFDTKGCWQDKGPTKTLTGATAPYNRTGIGVGYGIITVKMLNGSNLDIDGFSAADMKNLFGTDTTGTSLVMYIDANGDKLPNVIGKDIFILVWTPDGLFPAGINETTETINQNCSKEATGSNAGYYCLMKIKNNGWEIPKDVWNIKVR